MTIAKNLKRKVRERMKRTGERYMTALRAISEGRPDPVQKPDRDATPNVVIYIDARPVKMITPPGTPLSPRRREKI